MTVESSHSYTGTCGFLKQVLRGRWFMVFASFLIMSTSGSNYIFGLFSGTIKSNLEYTQSDLNLISTFKDWGSVFGIPTGLLSEVAPNWVVLFIGCVLNFIGYFLVYLAVLKKITRPNPWLMSVYIFIGANSANFFNTGSYILCVKNFPESRGMMIGLMKGMLGLSGALFTQIYNAGWGGTDPIALILLIAWVPSVVSLVFITTMRPLKISTVTTHPHEKKFYYQIFCIAFVLGLILLLLTIFQTYIHFNRKGYILCCIFVFLVLFSPLYMVIREELYTRKTRNNEDVEENTNSNNNDNNPEEVEVTPQVMEVQPQVMEVDHVAETTAVAAITAETTAAITAETTTAAEKSPNNFTCFNKPKRGSDFGIMQAICSMDMLLLFVITFCGFGCCQATINNFGQIGQSLYYPSDTLGAFVSLISIWNFYGRIVTGFISDYLLRKWEVPRTILLICALLVSALGNVLIALHPFHGCVYLASLLTGLSYGCQLTLVFVHISEFFGLKHFPMLANCGNLVSPLGLYTFNVIVVGKLYDVESLRQFRKLHGPTALPTGDLTCMGTNCFKLSFLILGAANAFGACVGVLLYWRTRNFYKSKSKETNS